jgi:ABC-2 type transport system permease protein
LRGYLAIIRIRFANGLQYRAAALAGVFTQFAWGSMEILAFQAFYNANPGAFPMDFQHTVSYIWLQEAFLSLFTAWFFEPDILAAITGGSIAYKLARPVDLYNRWFCQSMANRLSKAVLRCFPVLLVAFLAPAPFRMAPPPGAAPFFLFLLSAALSLCVVIAFIMLVYVSTFYTMSPTGGRMVSAALAEFLAGGTIPLPFFPEPFRSVAEMLPFAAMQNMPLRIFSGDIAGAEAARGILLQVFWLLTLVLLGKRAMKNALEKVVVQGG